MLAYAAIDIVSRRLLILPYFTFDISPYDAFYLHATRRC